jgi:prepilin peptidase CpaA
MSSSPGSVLWLALLSAMLLAACAWDLRVRRIPNALVLGVLAAGVVRALCDGPLGLGAALLGAVVGLLVWLPPYALGVLGAGDVKLFAAAAAWIGPAAVPEAAIAVGAAGGVLGLAWLVARAGRSLRQGAAAPALLLAARVGGEAPTGVSRIPYGVAIAAGLLAVLWRPVA